GKAENLKVDVSQTVFEEKQFDIGEKSIYKLEASEASEEPNNSELQILTDIDYTSTDNQTANPIEIFQGTEDQSKLILHESGDTAKAENLEDDVSQAVYKEKRFNKGEKSTQEASKAGEEHDKNKKKLHISTDIDDASQDSKTANLIVISQGTKDENKLILHESVDIDTGKAENLKDIVSQAFSKKEQLDKCEKSIHIQEASETREYKNELQVLKDIANTSQDKQKDIIEKNEEICEIPDSPKTMAEDHRNANNHKNELQISTDIDDASQDNKTANLVVISQGTKDESKLILHESVDTVTGKAENLKVDVSQTVFEEKQFDIGEKSIYKLEASEASEEPNNSELQILTDIDYTSTDNQTANPIEIFQGTEDQSKLILHESGDTAKAENLEDDVSQAVYKEKRFNKGEKSTQEASKAGEEHDKNKKKLHISTDIDDASQDSKTANLIVISQGTKDENKLILHESVDIDTGKAENLKDIVSQAFSKKEQLDKCEKSIHIQEASETREYKNELQVLKDIANTSQDKQKDIIEKNEEICEIPDSPKTMAEDHRNANNHKNELQISTDIDDASQDNKTANLVVISQGTKDESKLILHESVDTVTGKAENLKVDVSQTVFEEKQFDIGEKSIYKLEASEASEEPNNSELQILTDIDYTSTDNQTANPIEIFQGTEDQSKLILHESGDTAKAENLEDDVSQAVYKEKRFNKGEKSTQEASKAGEEHDKNKKKLHISTDI
ncbi:jg467, partial [Pararge aegeria aegeria]